jgi:tetratricopeptide (TPR) repeat protein
VSRRQPSLIAVEDVHYADEVTLDYLRELMRATFEVPLVLLLTTRPNQDPLSADWQSIAADAPITIISLRPLRGSESKRLAASFQGLQHSTVAACIERSDGNPLFLIELLRAAQRGLLGSMPTSVQTIAVARLDELRSDDREAIQAAAVLGQRFELETLRGLLGRSDYEPTSLIDTQFIRQEGDNCLFNHGLIKDAIVGTLLRSNRQRLHRNAAAWFEDLDLGLWAFHLDHAGDPSASEAYETAARAEATRFRFEQALDFIDRAIAISDEANKESRFQHLRGEYLLGIGATQQAAEAFTSSATQGKEPELTCRARIGLAHALRDLGEYERGLEVLNAAQGDAEHAGLTRELAEIFHHRGNIKQLEVDAQGCREANTEALRYARESGSPELEALALGGLARASVVSRHFKSEQRYAIQCIEICRDNGLEHIEFTFRHFVALTAFYSADVDTACQEFKACVERGPQVGALRPAIIANLTYGEVLLELTSSENLDISRAFKHSGPELLGHLENLGQLRRSSRMPYQRSDAPTNDGASSICSEHWSASRRVATPDWPLLKRALRSAVALAGGSGRCDSCGMR